MFEGNIFNGNQGKVIQRLETNLKQVENQLK